jgi:hypothetical protein
MPRGSVNSHPRREFEYAVAHSSVDFDDLVPGFQRGDKGRKGTLEGSQKCLLAAVGQAYPHEGCSGVRSRRKVEEVSVCSQRRALRSQPGARWRRQQLPPAVGRERVARRGHA